MMNSHDTKMNQRIVRSLLITLTCTIASCRGVTRDLHIPAGFQFLNNEQRPIQTHGRWLDQINQSAASFDAPVLGQEFAHALSSSDPNIRAYSAWILRSFPSKRTLHALLEAGIQERNPAVRKVIHDTLSLVFVDLFSEQMPETPESMPVDEQLSRWHEWFQEHDYYDSLVQEYKSRVNAGHELAPEAILGSLSVYYDPQLVGPLLDMYEHSRTNEQRKHLRNIVLGISGVDLNKVTVKELRGHLSNAHFMNRSEVSERYLEYFESNGYDRRVCGGCTAIATSVLKRSKDSVEQSMASRLLMWGRSCQVNVGPQ